MEQRNVTDGVLKWVAAIVGGAITALVVWKVQSIETDMRAFAVSIAQVQTTLSYQKESIDTLAFQVHELQAKLLNDRIAMGE